MSQGKNKFNNTGSSTGRKSKDSKTIWKPSGKAKGFKPKVQRDQPKADSKDPRINLDNTRITKVEKDIEKGSKQFGRNDISFWNSNPEMLKSAGSLPFAHIAGMPIESHTGKKQVVPGIMTLEYSPTIGGGLFPVAVNKSSNNNFSFLVHANSRNYAYNGPDLHILMQAGSEVFIAISYAARAYGIVKYAEEANLYSPDSLLAAMGFDPIDFRNSLGQIWFDINDFIVETQKIWVPKDFKYLTRNFDLLKTVYKDAEGPRAQFYLFRRKCFYKYNENGSEHGGFLEPAYYYSGGSSIPMIYDASTRYKWAQFRDMVRDMIRALGESEDRGIIYGDLLNAYGASNIYTMAPFDSSYKVTPEYNAEIMTQIENLTTCELFPSAFLQYQGSNSHDGMNTGPQLCTEWSYNYGPGVHNYTQAPAYTSTTASINLLAPKVGQITSILNFHYDGQPTPEAIMTATRFKAGDSSAYANVYYDPADKTVKTKLYIAPNYMGTEVINTVYISRIDTTISSNYAPPSRMFLKFDSSFTGSHLATLMAFDWHPFAYIWDANLTASPDGSNIQLISDWKDVAGDFDNYIKLTKTELQKLHETALYSLYDAKFTG